MLMPAQTLESTSYIPLTLIKRGKKDSRRNEPVINMMGSLKVSYPCTADEALYHAFGGLVEIAAFYAHAGATLGHIKAFIECEGGVATFSLTQKEVPQICRRAGWDGRKEVRACKLSLSILSLSIADAPVEDLLASLIQP